MSEAPGEAFGPYLVHEQLGSGGMASVHRAEVSGIEGFRRPVALERMLPHLVGLPMAVVWVLLAAAVAAVGVYFLLPLVT